jgi:bifunctional UDP-N-acetylglucosamine pyrophosphorylase/glucosamine-1-phosphate N-acetyltransferase
MGDEVRTGISVSIMPGVRVGPGTFIGPGVVVYEDVEANQMILTRQSLVRKPIKRHVNRGSGD